MANILLADDEESERRTTKRLLEAHDHSVEAVSSAGAALRLMAGSSFDLVISDYTMPGMTGVELLQRLRQLNNNVPFILHSSWAGPELGQFCRELHASYWPKNTAGLAEKVGELLAA